MNAVPSETQAAESSARTVATPVIGREIYAIEGGAVRDRYAPVIAALEDGVRSEAFPGAVLAVISGGAVACAAARGVKWSPALIDAVGGVAPEQGSAEETKLALANAASIGTVYDLGTLTGPLLTIPLLMQYVRSGQLCLTDRVSRYLQGFGVHGKAVISVEQLLLATAGLPHGVQFYEELSLASGGERIGILTTRGAKQYVYTALHRLEPKYPPGSRRVSSDLNAILLGELAETLSGTTLDRLARRAFLSPLGLRSTSFVDLGMMKRRGIQPIKDLIAPVEYCSWRKRVLCGEVFNPDAWAMGGIAGHAGLFSDINDTAAIVLEFMRALNGRGSVLDGPTIHRFMNTSIAGSRSDQSGTPDRLGFEAPSKDNGGIDTELSPDSFGAVSDTGSMFWVDRSRELGIVLLTNKYDPKNSNRALRNARATIINEVISAIS